VISDLDGLAERVAHPAPGDSCARSPISSAKSGCQLARLDIEASVTLITDAAAEVRATRRGGRRHRPRRLADLLRPLSSTADAR
jgi:hypothetical protein